MANKYNREQSFFEYLNQVASINSPKLISQVLDIKVLHYQPKCIIIYYI